MSVRELNQLFEKALTVNFDDKSKIVLVSDVHRGDGTYCDSLLPNRNIYITALKYYLRNNYMYIELGDGDELWKNRNCNEIAYCYNDVFKVLNRYKSNKTIYLLYGNHDNVKKNKSFNVKQELEIRKCGEAYGEEFIKLLNNIEFYPGINLMYTPLKEKFLVTHGHQLDLFNNELSMINRFLVRYIWRFLNGVGGFKDPSSSAKGKTKRSRIDIKLQAWARDNGKMIVCGHTHNSRFPNYYEPPYFNDGCCVLPYSMTCIEIQSGKISLIKWSIDAQESGVLWVKRKVIAGPALISNYLLWAKDARSKINENNKI